MAKDCLMSAIEVWQLSNWSSIDNGKGKYSAKNESGEITEYTLQHEITPERQMYKKELVKNLTKDAKYVIKLILDTPEDFLEFLAGKNGEPKRYRVISFLQISGWSNKRVVSTTKELCKFVGEYYG